MKVIRFKTNNNLSQLAAITKENNIFELAVDSFQDLLNKAEQEGKSCSQLIEDEIKTKKPLQKELADLELLAPVVSDEVWAAGVTYSKSREARNREAKVQTNSFYDKVYEARRPELFLKSTARRLIGPNIPVGIRTDSNWQIPEPELALVIKANGDIVGYTIGNDMSSRDIEGENPLYLPQAKMWKHSCAIGPAILLADTINDPYNLEIQCRIKRNGDWIFQGNANTSMLKRTFNELVSYLIKDNDILDGTTLLTGTCIIPDDTFTLQEGDLIEIEIESIGVLRNPVKIATNIKRGE
ncbi:fumarylacetoacetate hydrolase family protein [Gracilibacillus boraciitolerans JCM 21714]|uniref:Fumarylacetoacetate hydrolase family protein n=1 Tax=Gracilibacillus boraciitolerans JCM 21714 TaxID=1298598 RepID=W4VG41_9BACI|nr:fumarylacetoacetate hydrolase family protein [Gracilibacillus boraciitolerans]GAE92360.1 fumarylacetoacetate hydrolase family protein [Gracilibacillus boraciitolerans JCM 21714]